MPPNATPAGWSRSTTRNVAFALLGALVLVLKNHYAGPGVLLVHGYAGNVFVSFALYFAALSGSSLLTRPRVWAGALTLAAVTAFELTDGFGVLTNVYDPVDLAANTIGIAMAIAIDLATDRTWRGAG